MTAIRSMNLTHWPLVVTVLHFLAVSIGDGTFHEEVGWCLCFDGVSSVCHYIDVIKTTMASQITSLTVVYSTVYSDADQRKHQSIPSLAFVWGIHRDRRIPRTKGKLRGKCLHLMTSSCGHRGFSCHGTGVIYICGKKKKKKREFLGTDFKGQNFIDMLYQTGSGLMRLYSWSKGVKGNSVWVITTRVFLHSHDFGQCVVSSPVNMTVQERYRFHNGY